MTTLDYIVQKFTLDLNARRMPIEISNVGRNDLTRLFAELDFRVGVEIGVEQGVFTEALCKANPQAQIYGVDPWRSYSGYRCHVSQEKLDGFYEATRTRLVSHSNYELIRKFSMEAVGDFDDDSLDFVYIDGNHTLPFIINDIIEWSKKVRLDGIVSGHDYRKNKRFITLNHVVYAVNAYTGSYRVRPWFLLGSKAKIPGQVRDSSRSWMWVKRWKVPY